MMLKVCGATGAGDVDLLHAAGVELVGLWYGVTAGRAELSVPVLASLADVCRATGTLEPVLVTFLHDPDVIVAAARRADIAWLQLHGYQPPALVASLKRSLPDVAVIKVVHVRGLDCVERRMFGSYERAGTDLFLLDALTDTGMVGSTGNSIDSDVVLELIDGLSLPFLLAGGISAETRPQYDEVVAHPLFAGVDVDTAARDIAGRMRFERVVAIRQHWPSVDDEEGAA